MITATLDKNWRDNCFGELDFDKLEYFLMMAYHVCKDIDSTEWFDHWPDAIRFHIAKNTYTPLALNASRTMPPIRLHTITLRLFPIA